MKTQTISPTAYYACKAPGGHPLPNTRQNQFSVEKLVDCLLSAAITLAMVVISLVLITM